MIYLFWSLKAALEVLYHVSLLNFTCQLFLFASLRVVKEAFLLGPSCVQVNFSPFICGVPIMELSFSRKGQRCYCVFGACCCGFSMLFRYIVMHMLFWRNPFSDIACVMGYPIISRWIYIASATWGMLLHFWLFLPPIYHCVILFSFSHLRIPTVLSHF